MGGIFRAIGRIASVALPIALTVATGGAAAPLTFGSMAASIGKSLAMNAITGALSSALAGGGSKKQNPVTGQMVPAAAGPDPSIAAAEDERRRRVALNAAGASGNTTTPLGVTAGATVTKRNLLGM